MVNFSYMLVIFIYPCCFIVCTIECQNGILRILILCPTFAKGKNGASASRNISTVKSRKDKPWAKCFGFPSDSEYEA